TIQPKIQSWLLGAQEMKPLRAAQHAQNRSLILAPAVEQNHYGAIGLPFRQPTDRARARRRARARAAYLRNLGSKAPTTEMGLHPYPLPVGLNTTPYQGRPATNYCAWFTGFGSPTA